MKLLITWIGFFLITLLLAVVGPLVWDMLNSYPSFRIGFNAIYAIGVAVVFFVTVFLLGRLLLNSYKATK